MGSVGDCHDNSVIESFWSRMQVELLDTKRWKTKIELVNVVFDYLDLAQPPPAAQPARHAFPDRVRAQSVDHRGMRIQDLDSTEPGTGQSLRTCRSGSQPPFGGAMTFELFVRQQMPPLLSSPKVVCGTGR
jgi:hypothetical protein